MAKNRHSINGCPTITPFEKELKKRFFPTLSISHLTILRGILQDAEEEAAEDAAEDFSTTVYALMRPDTSGLSREEEQTVLNKFAESFNAPALFDSINTKLQSNEDLSETENKFMESYAKALQYFISNEENKAIVEREMRKAGAQTLPTSKMYTLFKSKIPTEYRQEVSTQLCAIVIKLLDRLETKDKYKHLTRREIIESYTVENSPQEILRGFDAIMYTARQMLQFKYKELQDLSKAENGDSSKKPEMSPERDNLFKTLIEDDDAWMACVFMAKSYLLEAEKIKIGNEVSYIEDDLDEDDLNNADSTKEYQSAETEGAEHWQLRADTISSFNSMSREVRSILYKLTTGKPGVLGFGDIIDTMLIHQNLMELRGEKFCLTSAEFMKELQKVEAPWAKQLYKILSEDAWKRTALFNTYRRNHLNYVFHRRDTKFDEASRSRVTVYYRNKNRKNDRVLMGAYRAGVLDIDKDNKICLFTSDGGINETNKNILIKSLSVTFSYTDSSGAPHAVNIWDPIKGIYLTELWGTGDIANLSDVEKLERKRDFIISMGQYFNLHLNESDVDIIMGNDKEFKDFCSSINSLTQDLKSGARHRTIDSLLEKGPQVRHFQRLVRSAKHTVTIQERNSPIEGSFRYNKSTYMTHTIPSNIGDVLERLGKAASEGVKSFRQFLEDNYLCCPVFATKTDSGYIIYNDWLKRMYNSTQEELNNPSSFVNRFINELTRGLGTDSVAFENFSERDNFLFTLNEYLQNQVESGGKFGATPLFVTGDSNSTRFLTTPILTSEEIISNMVTNALQEMERMKTFSSIINFLKENNLKLSEGHGGKTIDEWMQEDEKYRPSILRNTERFTTFSFLNSAKDRLLDLYSNSERIDETTGLPNGTKLRQELRQLIVENLRNQYGEFTDSLVAKNIAKKVGKDNVLLNPEALSILAPSGKVLNTSDPNVLWNFYLNSKFNLIQELQFLTVDTGFYKNTEDLQKRFKENIASGDLLDLEAIDPSDETGQRKIDDNNGYQKVRYIDEILTNLDASDEEGGSQEDRDFMATLRNNGVDTSKVKKYNKNTLTDGQGYRSFKSYRKLMIMRGEPHWTKAHEEAYQIIQRNREAGRTRLSREDYQRILDLHVVFQPLKPFYFGFERLEMEDGSIALIPVQHKYSEYPIIPELLPANCRLGELGRAMEKDGTDLVCCTTCVKVGGFGSTSVKDCKTSADFKESFGKGHAHQLKLDGWRQQSNVPEHVDSSRARGTQFTKHGYGSIAETTANKQYGFVKRIFKNGLIKLTKNKTIDVSQGLNQQNLIELYGALGSAGYIHSFLQLDNKVTNPKEFSTILSELRANDSRGAKDNIAAYSLDDQGETLLSPAEGIMAADNMASLLSKLRKDVIKQPIKGGSAVQVSAYGFEDVLKVHTDKDNKNILYADCAGAFAFSVSLEDGTTLDLSDKYLDFVDPDTGMLLDEDGNGVEPLDATGKAGEEFYGWNTKLGKLYPGILDLIAYRIPTEKAYSIINLKFKRFFPKTAGGILMVPSQFTTIAGFDFDIDKLYFIRREYRFNKLPSISNYKVWTDFYKKSPIGRKIQPYLKAANEAALNNEDGALYLGKDDYMYWGTALDNMQKSGEDISDIPKTAEEAFSEWLSNNISEYATPSSLYDTDKTVLENSQSAVNNLFFDYMQARLEDPDTFEERYTPGGFQQLKDTKPAMMAIRYASKEQLIAVAKDAHPAEALLKLANEHFKDYSPNYDPTELTTVAHYQTYNALYDMLIGVAANQNINQRLTALLNTLELNEAVKFGSLLDSKDSKAGKDIRARMVNGMDTELLTTEFLAAAVDAVKDALLEFYGMDNNNFNISCLMAKIGCAPLDIGVTLNQPVIVRAMELIKESGGFKSLSNAMDEALQELAGKSYRDLKDSFYYSLSEKGKRDNYVTTDKLVTYIGMDASPDYLGDFDTFIKGQMAVVHLMKELQADAQELSEQVNISKSTSTNSVKSTFGEIEAVIQKAKAFSAKFGGKDSKYKVALPSGLKTIINPFLKFTKDNAEEVLGKCLESPYCMEQIAFSCLLGYADSICNYFPYMSDGFQATADGLAALTTKGYLSAEIFDAHNKAAMLFFLERMVDLFNETNPALCRTPNGKLVNMGVPNRVFYNTLFPIYFDEILKHNDRLYKEGKTDVRYLDIPILGSISVQVEDYTKGANKHKVILKMDSIGGLKNTQKDNLIESWEGMFNSDDPVLQDLAIHLFMYSYYSRGFEFGPTTFMSLVPLVVKMNLGDRDSYREFFNRVFNLDNSKGSLLSESNGNVTDISIKDYLKAFILNNKDNFYQFTKKIYAPRGIVEGSAYSRINANMSEDKSTFTVTVGEDADKPIIEQICVLNRDESGNVISAEFTPLVEINGAVYICDSNIDAKDNAKFNIIESGTMIYYRMDTPLKVDYSTPERYGTHERSLAATGNGAFIEVVKQIKEEMNEQSSSIVPASSTEEEDNSFGGDNITTTTSVIKEHPFASLVNNLQSAFDTITRILKVQNLELGSVDSKLLEKYKDIKGNPSSRKVLSAEEKKGARKVQENLFKMITDLSGEEDNPISENTKKILENIRREFLSDDFFNAIHAILGSNKDMLKETWTKSFDFAAFNLDEAFALTEKSSEGASKDTPPIVASSTGTNYTKTSFDLVSSTLNSLFLGLRRTKSLGAKTQEEADEVQAAMTLVDNMRRNVIGLSAQSITADTKNELSKIYSILSDGGVLETLNKYIKRSADAVSIKEQLTSVFTTANSLLDIALSGDINKMADDATKERDDDPNGRVC